MFLRSILHKIERKVLKFTWKDNTAQAAKGLLSTKNRARDISIPDLMSHYRAAATQTETGITRLEQRT